MGMRVEQAVRDALRGQPLARHIVDFLTDLANANKPRNAIRAYRGDRVLLETACGNATAVREGSHHGPFG